MCKSKRRRIQALKHWSHILVCKPFPEVPHQYFELLEDNDIYLPICIPHAIRNKRSLVLIQWSSKILVCNKADCLSPWWCLSDYGFASVYKKFIVQKVVQSTFSIGDFCPVTAICSTSERNGHHLWHFFRQTVQSFGSTCWASNSWGLQSLPIVGHILCSSASVNIKALGISILEIPSGTHSTIALWVPHYSTELILILFNRYALICYDSSHPIKLQLSVIHTYWWNRVTSIQESQVTILNIAINIYGTYPYN